MMASPKLVRLLLDRSYTDKVSHEARAPDKHIPRVHKITQDAKQTVICSRKDITLTCLCLVVPVSEYKVYPRFGTSGLSHLFLSM